MSPAACSAVNVSLVKMAELFQKLFRYIDPRTLYRCIFKLWVTRNVAIIKYNRNLCIFPLKMPNRGHRICYAPTWWVLQVQNPRLQLQMLWATDHKFLRCLCLKSSSNNLKHNSNISAQTSAGFDRPWGAMSAFTQMWHATDGVSTFPESVIAQLLTIDGGKSITYLVKIHNEETETERNWKAIKQRIL